MAGDRIFGRIETGTENNHIYFSFQALAQAVWARSSTTAMSNKPHAHDDVDILYDAEAIQQRVSELGAQISADYGDESITVVGILNRRIATRDKHSVHPGTGG